VAREVGRTEAAVGQLAFDLLEAGAGQVDPVDDRSPMSWATR
jgi:hypothetical protein